MERLTYYFELGAYTDKRNNIIDVSDKLTMFENGVIMGKPIDRLAEFEDFMEANKFNNIRELQDAVNGKFQGFFDEKHKIWIQTVAKYTKCEKENQALKSRWQKLKEHIEKERNTNSNIGLSCSDCMYSNAEMFCEELLEKMQELEKE